MIDNTISAGERIKSMRLAKGMSIADLAGKTGIPVSTLSSIEDLSLSPPLSQIICLAKVLGIAVGKLFGDSGDSPFAIVRCNERTEVSRFSAEHSKSCGYSYHGLGQQKGNRQMEPFVVTLKPTDPQKTEPNQHIGEEFVFVLEGRVEVNLQDHRDILNPGDSIYYDSKVPHTVSCHGDSPATILAVIYTKEEMIIL